MKKSFGKRVIAWLLAVVMICSALPAMAFAADTSDDFLRVFHLDSGRKYFTVSQVQGIIDSLSANGYTHLELVVGNQGLRFLLDDMSVTVGDTTYNDDAVTAGVQAGNVSHSHSGEWSQAEMDEIIAYATSKHIEIIPLLNSPGHMNAILDAMEAVGISNPSYDGSARTVDVTNTTAVAFTQALIKKYAAYFAGKGCSYFNMGADEYANDVYGDGSMGFGQIQSAGHYDEYITYVNNVAAIIKEAGMTPMAFNDGIYFNNVTNQGTFDKDIVIAYWTSGWSTYVTASAATLASKGHKILNANDGWYYVLGRNSGDTYSLTTAKTNVANTPVTDVPGSNDPTPIGAMMCLWCDTPSASYSATEVSNVTGLIETLATNNSDYFVVYTEPVVEDVTETDNSVSVTAPGLTSLRATQITEDVPTVENALGVVAYQVTPVAESGNYTGEATVTIPVPADWTNVRGGVLASENGDEVMGIRGTLANGEFTFTVPHFSTVVAYEVEAIAVEVTENKTITLTVGGTATDTITDANYTGNVDQSELDEAIASVNVAYGNTPGSTVVEIGGELGTTSGEYIITDGNGNYLTYSGTTISNTTKISEATVWTVTATTSGDGGNTTYNYTLNDGSYYLSYSKGSFSISSWSSTWRYTAGSGLYSPNGGGTSRNYLRYYDNAWQVVSANSRDDDALSAPTGKLYTKVTTTTDPVNGTTVTFTGKAEGTTYVTVGNTRYTVIVTDTPPSNAMTGSSLTVEQWITNIHATTTSGGSTYTFNISNSSANSTDGVDISTLAPANAYWSEGTLYYWQAVRLDSANKQTTTGGDDETADGTRFTHVRYHNGAWQYKDVNGVWHYFLEDDQVVAYYLQKITVTSEIDTYFKDWGWNLNNEDNYNHVGLSVAVVYPDGSLSSTEEEIFQNATILYNYESGNKSIGLIAPANNSTYTIAKITVTPGMYTGSNKKNWSSDYGID